MPQKSIGLIEFKGLTGAMAAADAAAKAANIDLAACEVTTGACVMLRIEGDLVAVQQATEAATLVARKLGQFLTSKIIPRPHDGLAPLLATRGYHNRLTESSATATPAPKKVNEPKPAERAQPKPEPKPQPKPAPKAAPVAEPPTPKTPAHPQPAPKPQPSASQRPATSAAPDLVELERMPVVKLRQYARTIANLPIQGREISMANKSQLLDAIRTTLLN